MIGHDSTWVPGTLKLLRDELPNLRVVISKQNSPQLGEAVADGRIDAAFLRREDAPSDLEFRLLAEETFEVFLPADHRLAGRTAIDPQELEGETFLSISRTALSISCKPPALRRTIDASAGVPGADDRSVGGLSEDQQIAQPATVSFQGGAAGRARSRIGGRVSLPPTAGVRMLPGC